MARLAAFVFGLAFAAMFGVIGAESAAQTGTEKIAFPSNDADLTKAAPTELSAWLLRPEGAGPFPAIVLLHGCSGLYSGSQGEKLSARHDEWARKFRDAGYVALLPDSFNPRGHRQVCTLKDRPILSTRERPRDAYGALLFLQRRNDVIANRIAVMGWSHGGQTTLATLNPKSPGRPKVLPKGDFRAGVALYPGCTTARDQAYGSVAPMLLLVGEADDWTPAAPCVAFAEAARERGAPIEVVAYPGAYHDFDAPNVPIRLRTGLAIPGGGTSAHIGTDPAARADALDRVPRFLSRILGQ